MSTVCEKDQARRMRVMILADSYYPVCNSCGHQIHELALEIRSRGHQVSVLTPSDRISEDCLVLWEDGIEVLRFKSDDTKSANRVRRAMVEVRLSEVAWRRAKEYLRQRTCDLVIFYSPTIFWGRLVQRMRSMWNCRTYLILRDLFPDWARDTGVLPGGPIFWYFRHRAIEQFKAADVIGLETSSSIAYLLRTYPDQNARLEVLHNWTRVDSTAPPSTEFRHRFNLEGKIIFIYGGNIGVAQNMDNLMRLATKVRSRQEIQFVLIGRGSEVQRLRNQIKREKVSNVLLLDAVAEAEYMGILAACDVGIINLDQRLKSHNVPGKLLGYLRCGKPVLASVNPGNDLTDIIENGGVGLCSVTGEEDHLLSNCLRIVDDPQLRKAMGENAVRLLTDVFSVRKAADQVLDSECKPTYNPTTERASEVTEKKLS